MSFVVYRFCHQLPCSSVVGSVAGLRVFWYEVIHQLVDSALDISGVCIGVCF